MREGIEDVTGGCPSDHCRDSREVKQAMRNQNRREYEQMRRNRLHTRVASPQIIGEVLLVLRSNRTVGGTDQKKFLLAGSADIYIFSLLRASL